jgi:oligopeptide/dipeptide ABC transporter ATP-binding protein
MPTLLEVSDLHVEFRTDRGVVHAVNGVDLVVERGQTVGLVGESGCGKSVTALAVLGLLAVTGNVTGGRIALDGRDLQSMHRDRRRAIRGREVAMIFQDPMTSLNPVMPVGRQIGEALQAHLPLDRRAADRRAVELLELVGIPAARRRAADYPHQFSGGMRQRVMVAMAVSCGPKLLIADEPTTALDVTIQAQVLDLLRHLVAQAGMALLLISHDLGVVAGTCVEANVMYAGRVVERGTTRELFARPRHPYTVGLLASIPRLDGPRKASLVPIAGAPPSLDAPPAGCPFAPRCPRRLDDVCWQQMPPLELVEAFGSGHAAACHNPAPVRGPAAGGEGSGGLRPSPPVDEVR